MLGLFPALVFDPTAQVCTECPRNLLLVHDSADLFKGLTRIGIDAALGWSLALIVPVQLARATPAWRRLVWPVSSAAAVYLAFVSLDAVGELAQKPGQGEPSQVLSALDRGRRLTLGGCMRRLRRNWYRHRQLPWPIHGPSLERTTRPTGRLSRPTVSRGPSRGSGLRGLADRVEALGGRLRGETAPGGTRVVAEIPLASASEDAGASGLSPTRTRDTEGTP
jgi:hypothetical protein